MKQYTCCVISIIEGSETLKSLEINVFEMLNENSDKNHFHSDRLMLEKQSSYTTSTSKIIKRLTGRDEQNGSGEGDNHIYLFACIKYSVVLNLLNLKKYFQQV